MRILIAEDEGDLNRLIVKVLRSPHAHALIKEINTARAEAFSGSLLRRGFPCYVRYIID